MKNNFDDMELFYRAAWQSLSTAGNKYVAAVIQHFGSAHLAWQADDKAFESLKLFQTQNGKNILNKRRLDKDYPDKLQESCYNSGINVCSLEDSNYPVLLKQIANPPQILYYKGHLQSDRKRLALVGSRKITPYGRAVAEMLARDLSANNISIVSGGAYGVDTEAHKGTLKNGVTEAVLACGLDVPYPATNRKLFAAIVERGALISEYPPGTPPLKMFFPIRNRIIGGMCRGTIVIEAAAKSGSLITANDALCENRDVFAVPGSIYSESSLGCNKLIQQGAKLVITAEDILSEYEDWQGDCQLNLFRKAEEEQITIEEKQILLLLSVEVPLSIDEIIYKMGCGKRDDLPLLLCNLEIRGLIQKDFNGRYTKKVRYKG